MDMAGYSKTTATSEVVGPLKEEIIDKASMMLALKVLLQRFGPIKPSWTCVSVKLPVQRIGETGRVRA